MEEKYQLYNGDCLNIMNDIPDQSIDMIFADLPYNTTNCDWDCEIDLNLLWNQYKRIIKDHGVIALWAQAPFSHVLALSNLKQYRYEWVIEKTKATGHLNANKAPMKAHENVLMFGSIDEAIESVQIFYKKLSMFNPQMTEGHAPVHSYTKHTDDGNCYGKTKTGISGGGSTSRYPRDVLKFAWDTQKSKIHNCQKPLEACEYFIETYTIPGMTVLDNCFGSCSTGVAALKLHRKFIGIEKDVKIFNDGRRRLEDFINKEFETDAE
ncbi:DNA-methyltransferase [Lacrimispora amygdalina]|uniref:DNA-methyltransferase n=1 Tax=Lacrimispora amygdalina TaxID=253257 RepID=UPI001FA8C698|nr:DNA methyltransferase [Lacrimispora amygdalina]